MYETIDLLQQTTDYYYIDYIPYNTDDPNFLELEEYFEKHYLSSFSEKITKIILKIIYYYPCKVYLTEPTKDIPINSTLDFNSFIISFNPIYCYRKISTYTYKKLWCRKQYLE